jgi:hypothetical protein
VKEDVSRKVKKRRFSQRRKDRKENLSKKERKADSGAPPLSINSSLFFLAISAPLVHQAKRG